MAGNLTAMIASIFSGSAVTADPYYEYTTLLLPGNGTNGAQNNTFLDGSANNFTITRNGNTTQGTFSPFSQTGWGNYFDGTGDYLVAPSTANAAFAWGTGDYSIECWVYPIAAAYTRVFTSSVTANGSCDISSGGAVNYFDGTAYTIGTLSINQWTHLCITRKSGTLRTFKNGVMQYNGANSVNASSNANFGIAATAAGAQTGNLYIASVRMVKGGIPTAYDTSSTTNGTQIFTPPTSAFTGSESLTAGSVSLITCQSNRFIDNSTNNFTITVNGNTSVVPFSPFNPTSAWSASTVGGSGYFDGSGDQLTESSSALFSMGTGQFTIEFWVYRTASAFQTLFTSNSGSTSIQMFTNTGNTAELWIAASQLTSNFGSLALNSWNHVAVVRDGSSNMSAYVNGVRGYTAVRTDNLNNVGIRVGGRGSDYLSGYLSGFRWVSGAALYSGTSFTVPTSPPTATPSSGTTVLLLNFTNAGIYDATSKNDLETVGNAQISTAIPAKWGSGSMYFDGTGDYLLSPAPPGSLLDLKTGDYTIESWIYYPSSTAAFQTICGVYRFGDVNVVQYYFGVSSTNKLTSGIYASTTTFQAVTSSGNVPTSNWTHVAVTKSGTTLRLFINGTIDGTATITIGDLMTLTAATQFSSGALRDSSGNPYSYLNGYIQDLRITKGYARYTANFTPPTAAFPTL